MSTGRFLLLVGVTMLLVLVLISTMASKPIAEVEVEVLPPKSPITTYDMGDGVRCYTLTSGAISCVQVWDQVSGYTTAK